MFNHPPVRLVLSGLLALGTHIFAAEKAGPFDWSSRVYNPANPQDTAIARDGTLESAQKFEGTNQSGVVKTESWNGDSQAGSRIWGAGVNLFGPANQNFFIGLKKDWSLREGSDAGSQWIYYPKYQQDSMVMFGFAEIKAKDLDRANGTGFTLGNALPYNRLVVVLPWRWVQGGGSAYQAGDYGGNPAEAGLFAIPANMSLSQIQANTATYRLAGLDAVFNKIQPHLYSTSYKLQVLGNGRWQVLIDIDNDGQTDVATTSEDAGNKVSPFATLTETSGLIISTRAAPSRTLTVNRTTANLIYRKSPTAEVPSIDRRPFTANIPKVVKSSPTIIDGTSWDATYQVSATCSTIPTGAAPVAQIPGTNQWFFDLPLKPNGLSKVTFGQSGKPNASTIQGNIEWQPIDMYHGESLAIRIGDSVKLQCLASCGAQKIRIDADGDGVIDYRGPDTKQFLHRYDTAGTFLAKAYDADGVEVGSATIAVANVRLPKAIACQVGFTRTVDIHTGLYDPKDLYVTTNDSATQPKLIQVTRGSATKGHLRIYLKTLNRGTPIIYVRQGSETGPILAYKEVDEFYGITKDAQHLAVNDETSEANVRFIMTPYIPDLVVTFTMFAHTASFDGERQLSMKSNDGDMVEDPITGEISSVMDVPIQIPSTENKFCLNGAVFQQGNFSNTQNSANGESANSDVSISYQVGDAMAVNGDACRIKVSRLVIPDRLMTKMNYVKKTVRNRFGEKIPENDWEPTDTVRDIEKYLRVKVQNTCKEFCGSTDPNHSQKIGTCQRDHCKHVHGIEILPNHKCPGSSEQGHGNRICIPIFKQTMSTTEKLDKKCGYKQHVDYMVLSASQPGIWDVQVGTTKFAARIITPGMLITPTNPKFEPRFNFVNKDITGKGTPVNTDYTVTVIGKDYIEIDHGDAAVFNVSSEPGFCMNQPLNVSSLQASQRHHHLWKDLRFCQKSPSCAGECDCPGDGFKTEKVEKDKHKWYAIHKGNDLDGKKFKIYCDDFGAYGKLLASMDFSIKKGINCDGACKDCYDKLCGIPHCNGGTQGCDANFWLRLIHLDCITTNPCECMEPNGEEKKTLFQTTARITTNLTKHVQKIPVDENDNDIWDGWIPGNDGSADDDKETYLKGKKIGDGFTRYEEYRGFIVHNVINKNNGDDIHIRTNPSTQATLHIQDFAGLKTNWFLTLSGLEVLFIADRHWNSSTARVVNANWESHSEGIYQCGLRLVTEEIPPILVDGAWVTKGGYADYIDADQTKWTPKNFRKIVVNTSIKGGILEEYVTGHELFHGIGLTHHSDDIARPAIPARPGPPPTPARPALPAGPYRGADCIMRYLRKGEVFDAVKMYTICGQKDTNEEPTWACTPQFNVKDPK